MQRSINKEIRNYQEDVFMGLTLRQLICSIVAIGVAVGIYFSFQNALGQETVSWVCIVAAAPIAAAGFFEYDGMTFEQFLLALVHSEVLGNGPRLWKAENKYIRPAKQGKKKLKRKEEKQVEVE